jgi:hypothetical protein
VKTPELPNSQVNPYLSSQETRVRRSSSLGVQHSKEMGCAKVKSLEARGPVVTGPADITRDDGDTWHVCHMSVS